MVRRLLGKHAVDAKVTVNGGKEQILPVDWNGITTKGNVATNYQLLPRDRVHVKSK